MKIDLEELRVAFEKLLGHVVSLGGRSIAIPYEFYWSIPKERMYDNYEEPTNLTMGQLSDDIEELRKIGSGESAPVAHGCVWMAAVLRAIGDSHIG